MVSGPSSLTAHSHVSTPSLTNLQSYQSCWGTLGSRIGREWSLEWKMLWERRGRRAWLLLLLLLWQYIHGVCVHAVYYLHRPGPLLRDMGFELLPALGEHSRWRLVSEVTTGGIIVFGIFFLFAPFVQRESAKTFYTINLANRTLMVLMYCQALRVLSFFGTVLPGPNYHCRAGSPDATLPPPTSIWDVLWIGGRTLGGNCGDLIFSSHTIFILVFLLNYHKYGGSKLLKRALWATAAATAVFIIASRKHYTVDVVIAWYTVPLVYWFVDRRMGDRDVHGERLANLCVSSGVADAERGGLALYNLPKGKGENLLAAASANGSFTGGVGSETRRSGQQMSALRMFELLEENRLLREELVARGGSTTGSSAASDGSGSGGEGGGQGHGHAQTSTGTSSARAAPVYGGRSGRGGRGQRSMHRREPSAPDLLSRWV